MHEHADNTTNKAGEDASTNECMKKAAKAANNILSVVVVASIAVLIFSLVFAKVTGKPPAVFGYRMYIVLSGSMEPAFAAGSLAVVKPIQPEQIESGDIITYRGLGEREQLVSHRVAAVDVDANGDYHFTTKGDANDVADPNPITDINLVGKVVLAIPYLGIVMQYAKTKQGLLFLIIIPAAAVLGYELVKLCSYMVKQNKSETQPDKHGPEGDSTSRQQQLVRRKGDGVGTES